jgi:hypothetical protein
MASAPAITYSVIQNAATGAVDYLQFNGTSLVQSAMFNYISPGWKIVAGGMYNGDTNPDLVAQNQSTGQVDFLYLDQGGNLIGSAMSNTNVAPIHGQGWFGIEDNTYLFSSGQSGLPLVSQTSDGSIDLLAFSESGQLLGSDLVPNTAGTPPVVGVAQQNQLALPQGFNMGSNFDSNIVTQLANGQLEILSLSGDFRTYSVTLSLFGPQSLVLPESLPPVLDVDPQGFNVSAGGAVQGAVQMVGQLPNGHIDQLFFDAGYTNSARTGDFFASTLEDVTVPSAWRVVDGGQVAFQLFGRVVG